MKLDDLKQQWPYEHAHKSETDIRHMMSGRTVSVYRRIRRKAIVESVAFGVVLFVFLTGLDAHQNAWWVNLFFTGVIMLGIINNVMLYRSITLNATGAALHHTLRQTINRLWWQVQLSTLFSVLFFSSMLLFLLARIPLTDEKMMFALLILAISVGIRTWFEVGRWKQSIRRLNLCLLELTSLDISTPS